MFQKTQKNINVKVFIVITNKNEAKTKAKHISCDCKCKCNSTACNSNQKWNKKNMSMWLSKLSYMPNDYSWNPSICTCQNSKYLKRIANTSVIECDEIIIVIENVFKKMANTIAANVMSTASINCHSKK